MNMNTKNNNNYVIYMKSGLFAGIASITSIISYPLEVLKIRNHVLENKKQTRFLIKKMIRNEGVGSFYQGMSQNILIGIFGYGSVFFFYELLYYNFNKYTDKQMMNSIISSSIAGIISVIIVSPFNYTKTRQILIISGKETSLSTYKILKDIYDERNSILGFWKALNPSLITSFYSAIQITVYQLLKILTKNEQIKIREENKLKLSSLFGIISRIIACIAIYPFALLRSRMLNFSKDNIQSIKETNHFYISSISYKRVFNDLYHIIKNEGAFALFRGIKFELLKVVINGALFFYFYEYLHELYG